MAEPRKAIARGKNQKQNPKRAPDHADRKKPSPYHRRHIMTDPDPRFPVLAEIEQPEFVEIISLGRFRHALIPRVFFEAKIYLVTNTNKNCIRDLRTIKGFPAGAQFREAKRPSHGGDVGDGHPGWVAGSGDPQSQRRPICGRLRARSVSNAGNTKSEAISPRSMAKVNSRPMLAVPGCSENDKAPKDATVVMEESTMA